MVVLLPSFSAVVWVVQTEGKAAGIPCEKRKFHALKHSIAPHLLDAGGTSRSDSRRIFSSRYHDM